MPPVCINPAKPVRSVEENQEDMPTFQWTQATAHITLDEPPTAPLSSDAFEAEFKSITQKLDKVLFRLDSNLRFMKAVYRGTKKHASSLRTDSGFLYGVEERGGESVNTADSGFSAGSSHFSKKQISSPGSPHLERDVIFSEPSPVWKRNVTPAITKAAQTLENETLPNSPFKTNYSPTSTGTSAAYIGQTSMGATKTTKSAPSSGQEGSGGSVFDDHAERPVKIMEQLTDIMMQAKHSSARRSANIWRFLEDHESSRASLWFHRGRNAFLALTVLAGFAEIIGRKTHGEWLIVTFVQLGMESLFALELFVRFYCCPNRRLFCHSPYTFIDLMSLSPIILRMFTLALRSSELQNTDAVVAFLGIVPALRLLCCLRHYPTFQLVLIGFKSAAQVLPVLLFTLLLAVQVFGAIIYFLEPRSNIPSLPAALHFVIVFVSTGGYGENIPRTVLGRCSTALLAIIGPMYMAIPIGIIGHAFSQVWEDRHRLIILQKMRNCIINAGYSPMDLKRMFTMLDKDGDGTLDYDEFTHWLQLMNLNVSHRFVGQVFESFDADDEGTIDFDELLRGLFPKTHHLMTCRGNSNRPLGTFVKASMFSRTISASEGILSSRVANITFDEKPVLAMPQECISCSVTSGQNSHVIGAGTRLTPDSVHLSIRI